MTPLAAAAAIRGEELPMLTLPNNMLITGGARQNLGDSNARFARRDLKSSDPGSITIT